MNRFTVILTLLIVGCQMFLTGTSAKAEHYAYAVVIVNQGNEDFLKYINNDDLKGLRQYLDQGADPNQMNNKMVRPIHYAAFHGKLDVVKLLVEKGAFVNASPIGNWTALHYASFKGKYKTLAYLVDNGALIDTENLDGDTPLFYAIESNSLDAVITLVEKGADVNHINKNGLAPLDYAIEHRAFDLVSFLISKGARLKSYMKKKSHDHVH